MAWPIFAAFLGCLLWCLHRGRNTFKGVGAGHDPVVTVDRATSPTLLWAVWGSACAGFGAMLVAYLGA